MNIITYTFSSCQDIWEMYFESFKQHYPEAKHTILSNVKSERNFIGEEWSLYDAKEKYARQWSDLLSNYNEPTFLYSQEDFVLYDRVNAEKIDELNQYLINSPFDFIRLLRTGDSGELFKDNLYHVPNSSIFCMQSTIWKTKRFKLLYETADRQKHTEEDRYLQDARQMNLKGLYWYNGEKKRGMNHYDSSIFPCIATALVKGEWNLIEYRKELLPLIEKYKIDTKIRGTMLYY